MKQRSDFVRRTRFYKKVDIYLKLWYRYHRLFFHRLICRGKKIIAFNTFINVKYRLKLSEETNPYLTFLAAMIKASPTIFLLPLKTGRFLHGVPAPITSKKKLTLAVSWVVTMSKNKSRTISLKSLVNILIFSIYGYGPVIEKKKNTYAIGSKNRHLRRFFD